jgi:hypothetical protein
MQTSSLFPNTWSPLAAGRICRRYQADALGQSMVEEWLENGSRRSAALNACNVPRDEFLPSVIHNRFRFQSRSALE